MMRSIYITAARFCVTAWVGAAVLFVVTGVREVTADDENLTSVVINVLVPIRFNAYYLFGFVLLGLGTLSCGLYLKHPLGRSKRMSVCMLLLLLALIAMILDYLFIYLPLVGMITPPDLAKPANFRGYHDASKYINMFNLGLSLMASLILCLPKREVKS